MATSSDTTRQLQSYNQFVYNIEMRQYVQYNCKN